MPSQVLKSCARTFSTLPSGHSAVVSSMRLPSLQSSKAFPPSNRTLYMQRPSSGYRSQVLSDYLMNGEALHHFLPAQNSYTPFGWPAKLRCLKTLTSANIELLGALCPMPGGACHLPIQMYCKGIQRALKDIAILT